MWSFSLKFTKLSILARARIGGEELVDGMLDYLLVSLKAGFGGGRLERRILH
jgi:hypothetical protein